MEVIVNEKKRKNNVSVQDNKINVVHRVILSRVIRYIIGKGRKTPLETAETGNDDVRVDDVR